MNSYDRQNNTGKPWFQLGLLAVLLILGIVIGVSSALEAGLL